MRRVHQLSGVVALVCLIGAGSAQAQQLSMDDGLDAATYAQLDPAYAPPAAIDRGGKPGCGAQAPVAWDGTLWECTFSDDFDGSALGPAWTQQLTAQGTTGFAGGATSACFDGSPGNVFVAGGVLSLTVTKADQTFTCEAGNKDFGTRFRGGGVYSKVRDGHGFNQTYGRFDIRAALPATTGPGLQSALWMWPEDPYRHGAWPASGEIDIAEYYTQRPGFVVPTLHYAATPEKDTPKGINTVQDAFCHFKQPSAFHTYTLIWQPGFISVYYDGTLCLFDHYRAALLSSPAPFDHPFFLALSAALGVPGSDNAYAEGVTELPATTKIDWVRVWKAGTARPATAVNGVHKRARKPRAAKLRRAHRRQ